MQTFICRCAAEIPENDRNSFHGANLPQFRGYFFLVMEIPAEITLRQKFLPPDFVGMECQEPRYGMVKKYDKQIERSGLLS